MNSNIENSGGRAPLPDPARSVLALVLCLGLTGCFGILKPARPDARHFVLAPVAEVAPVAAPSRGLAVGVGRVSLPAYLLKSSLAVRKGTNEIDYHSRALWAERLDTGLQRVLAGNVAALLPTDRIRLSAWRGEDVDAEIHVAFEQFDVDLNGRAVLVAWWRILAPGGETTLESGECRLARQGPSPDSDPAAAIACLNELLADFSRQLTQALRATTPSSPQASGRRVEP